MGMETGFSAWGVWTEEKHGDDLRQRGMGGVNEVVLIAHPRLDTERAKMHMVLSHTTLFCENMLVYFNRRRN